VTLSADFRGKGRRPPTTVGIGVAECGIKISAVRYLVLSQSTHVTNRQTDRITTPKTALEYARAVKIIVRSTKYYDTKRKLSSQIKMSRTIVFAVFA